MVEHLRRNQTQCGCPHCRSHSGLERRCRRKEGRGYREWSIQSSPRDPTSTLVPNLQSHCPVHGSSNDPSSRWNRNRAGTARFRGLLSPILFLVSFRPGLCASQHLHGGLVLILYDSLLWILVGRLHGAALQRARDGMPGHGRSLYWISNRGLSLGATIAPVPTKSCPLCSSEVSKAETPTTIAPQPTTKGFDTIHCASPGALVVCPTTRLPNPTARGHASHYGQARTQSQRVVALKDLGTRSVV